MKGDAISPRVLNESQLVLCFLAAIPYFPRRTAVKFNAKGNAPPS
jgi:hypothetical protein